LQYIKEFDSISINDISIVGGKNANLGEMYKNLQTSGVKIPNGFASTSEAYWLFIKENNLKNKIKKLLDNINIKDIRSLEENAFKIRNLILKGKLPQVLEDQILASYKQLSEEYKCKNIDVAIRSSATAEDLPNASFAGQQESFLNVRGKKEVLKYVKKCFASLFTNRAISYRQSRGFEHFKVALSVGIQKMVKSDTASSGIIFTVDTENGCEDIIIINSTFGLGEYIVGGKINPDEFYVFKPTLKEGFNSIIKKELGSKNKKLIYSDKKRAKNIKTTKKERESFSLSDEEIITLANHAIKIEEHYQKHMDIEWAKDSITNEIFIVQARPETVHSQNKNILSIENYVFEKEPLKKDILLKGNAIGEKIGLGKVKIILTLSQAKDFKEGDVLVTNITDPDWEPLMKKASAVITNSGGRTCHAAIVAREIGVPAIVGTKNATIQLKDNQEVTVNCSFGEEGYVYNGIYKFYTTTMDVKELEETKTKLLLNIGNPEKAFSFAKLPNAGVGLARMEFIINNYIKAHPMALYDMYKNKEVKDSKKIEKLIVGYKNPKDFFVNRLALGISMIAAAFYPKPVVVRTSDFKSNEYKDMLGGKAYEKDEENPMIGFRGASRYYSNEYQKAFEWECEALKKVRDEMNFTNVKIMIPFVRTLTEGENVIKIMEEKGLKQGVNNLEIYAMCEIPSNVILADKFLEIFDGYSIGSNDLTQLTLGVDRDSSLISHIFDERNEAVKRSLKSVIQECKKQNKYIGICGQAPSDYPEITEFLVNEGIHSISLNPDSIIKMWQLINKLENKD
jgi:pyruvate,water dikinase